MSLQRTVHKLNDLLGRELGRTPYGDPIFQWEWSEDLFWPAFATGRMVKEKVKMQVPILECTDNEWGVRETGEYKMEEVEVDSTVPEYRKDRMTRERNKWFVTKWLSPQELIYGPGFQVTGRHSQSDSISHEKLLEHWNLQHPGADFPAKGWRVCTEASLPRGPYDPREPNLPDTEHFISRIKEQISMSAKDRLVDMLNYDERKEAAKDVQIAAEIRDCFPAFLNPKPGKRGMGWSFPGISKFLR